MNWRKVIESLREQSSYHIMQMHDMQYSTQHAMAAAMMSDLKTGLAIALEKGIENED